MDENRNNGINDPDEFAKIYLSVFGDQVPGVTDDISTDYDESTEQYYPESTYDTGDESISYQEYADEETDEYDTGSEDAYNRPSAASGNPEEIDFDPRFKLGNRKNYGRYAPEELPDNFADAEPKKTDEDDYSEFDAIGDRVFGQKSGNKKKFKDKVKNIKHRKKDEFSSDVEEDSDYDDYYDKQDDYSGSAIDKSDYIPSSFAKYAGSRLTGLILKLRGGVPSENGNGTVEADDEDLGTELPFMQASKFYGSQLHSLQLRTRISFVLLFVQCYLSLGLPAPGMLKSLGVAVASVMAIQLTIMLLALDVFTNGILNAFRGKLGADSIASFVCILTTLDALMVIYSNVDAHMPLCAASSISLIGVLFSNTLSARGLRKALRVPAIGKKAYTVTGEAGVIDKDNTILKSARPATGFVRRCEEAPPDEEIYIKIAPFVLLATLILSLLICVLKKNFSGLLFVYSGMLIPAVPFTALLCFAFPFCNASMRIFQSGTALAGWSGTLDIGKSKNLIITDRDLFPEDCVGIENVRIFADYDSDKVIAYAGSMIIASGCGLGTAFTNLMEENRLELIGTDNFEYLSGGGLKCMMEGHVVICGNSDIMRLMDIRIPYRLISNTSVLLAIDGILYGIFNISYTPDPKVRKALVSLMRSSRHPVFAIRDFNITPELIRDYFDVATDGYDFPPYVERYKLSEAKPARESKIAAVICREGLAPLITMADAGRSVYLVTIFNIVICLFSVILGVALVFIKFLTGTSIAAGFILLFMLLTSIPVIVLSILTLQVK